MLKKVILASLFVRPLVAAPLASDDSKFRIYDLPGVLPGPCDLCEGPDGALWGQYQLDNQIFRLDPDSGDVETFRIPFSIPPLAETGLPQVLGRTVLACAIRPGADGNIYAAFGTRNQLVRINLPTKNVEIFTPPNYLPEVGNIEPFNDLFTGPDGMYFTQTTANLVSFFNYSTDAITSVQVPTPLSNPLGTYYASDNKVYFTEFLANKIGVLDPATNEITEFPLPAPAMLGPAVVRAERDGYIYFTGLLSNSMGRLSLTNGSVDVFPNPTLGAFPSEDTIDRDGNIWFSTVTQNVLNKLDPVTGDITSVVIPGTIVVAPVSVPQYVTFAVNYGPGNALWFSEELPGKVGRYSLD